MFSVIYSFKVKPGNEQKFVQLWKEMTSLLYKNAGSLGSRLHKKDDTTYIAYAQWPNKFTWKNADTKLPSHAKEIRTKMKSTCRKIETLYEMDMLEDMLENEISANK